VHVLQVMLLDCWRSQTVTSVEDLVSGSHPTRSGACFSFLALEPHKRTYKSTRRYSTPCFPDCQ